MSISFLDVGESLKRIVSTDSTYAIEAGRLKSLHPESANKEVFWEWSIFIEWPCKQAILFQLLNWQANTHTHIYTNTHSNTNTNTHANTMRLIASKVFIITFEQFKTGNWQS